MHGFGNLPRVDTHFCRFYSQRYTMCLNISNHLIVNCCRQKLCVVILYCRYILNYFINIAHTVCLIDFPYFFLSETSLTHIIY